MVFDCFTFFNELELLEVRLHTLAPYVDAFVLCEANRTFQGAEKPYIFSQSRPIFGEIKNRPGSNPTVHGPTGKPVYIIRADLAGLDGGEDPWKREAAQRRAITDALALLRLDGRDRIILSDVDEIPNLEPFSFYPPDLWQSDPIIAWKQDLYYYWVNMRCWQWVGPVSCTWHTLVNQFRCDMQALRDYRHEAPYEIPGGWHFSFLGGAEAIKRKIEAFSHTEYRHLANHRNIHEALTERWKDNIDLFGRTLPGMKFELMPDDSHLPAYLRENRARFKDWWYR